MKHTILLASLLVTLAGCAAYQPLAFMRGSDITTSDQAPDTKQYTERAPGTGSSDLIKRTFSTQPPLIPHAIEKYLPITLEENDCMDCHITDEFKGKKMPRMGESHFSKTRKEEDGSPAVNMVRWQCNTCHVVQADAQPLVENIFVGNVAQ